MKKKEYESPTTQVAKLQHYQRLLSGSPTGTLPKEQEAEGGEQTWS